MSVKLRFDKHDHHMRIIDEFYELNKYIITEELKDALIDAKECIRYVIELNLNNDKPEDDTINSSEHKTNFDVIKEMSRDEMALFLTDVQCGDSSCSDKYYVRRYYELWLPRGANENDS